MKMLGFCQNWIFGQKFDFLNSVRQAGIYPKKLRPFFSTRFVSRCLVYKSRKPEGDFQGLKDFNGEWRGSAPFGIDGA